MDSDARLSNLNGGVDNTVYESYSDGGQPGTGGQLNAGLAWHRRISPETYIWAIIIGSLAGLWVIAGSFKKILS